jgi:hypothetical protein
MAVVIPEPGDVFRHGGDLIVCVKDNHGIQISVDGGFVGITDSMPTKGTFTDFIPDSRFQKELHRELINSIKIVRETITLIKSLPA